jgi:hypothetical protein
VLLNVELDEMVNRLEHIIFFRVNASKVMDERARHGAGSVLLRNGHLSCWLWQESSPGQSAFNFTALSNIPQSPTEYASRGVSWRFSPTLHCTIARAVFGDATIDFGSF